MIVSPAVVNGKVVFATSDSSLFHIADAATGKPVLQQPTRACVFSSPAVAGGVAYYGVLNGTLEARDLSNGALLWEYQTETAKKNPNWVLTADRKINDPLLFRSAWREAPIVAADLQFSIGVIFSSPLVVNQVLYFGSTDGYLYALD